MLSPTDVPTTIKIIKGLKPKLCRVHAVEYPDDLLEKSVDLADRYIKNKFPDKAVDVMDAPGARVKLRGEEEVILDDIPTVISKMSNIGKDVIDIDSTEGYKSLDKRIKTKVFGQDPSSLIQIVEAILVSKSGLRESTSPLDPSY